MNERVIQSLAGLVLLLFVSYIYFVNAIVWDSVGRQELLAEASRLTSETAVLESRYVALSGKVTLELAHSLGFQDAENGTGFAYRPAAAAVR